MQHNYKIDNRDLDLPSPPTYLFDTRRIIKSFRVFKDRPPAYLSTVNKFQMLANLLYSIAIY